MKEVGCVTQLDWHRRSVEPVVAQWAWPRFPGRPGWKEAELQRCSFGQNEGKRQWMCVTEDEGVRSSRLPDLPVCLDWEA